MDTKLDFETSVRIMRWQVLDFLTSIKSRVWNRGILLAWYRLWIRSDEFHSSLSIDPFAMRGMDEKKKSRYMTNLLRRRNIAHQRDMQSESGFAP